MGATLLRTRGIILTSQSEGLGSKETQGAQTRPNTDR